MEVNPMKNAQLAITDFTWRRFIKPRLFKLDAETAHHVTVKTLAHYQDPLSLAILRQFVRSPFYRQPLTVGGIPWRNPVGLAAGFDKQGECLPALDAMGFGNAEIGTIVPEPQVGSELPRVFRYPATMSLGNRYGFPSEGVVVVSERVRRVFAEFAIGMSVTFSIGANKTTPPDKLIDDYVAAYKKIRPIMRSIDAIKINISSPNTPGLRDVFKDIRSFVARLVERLRELPWELPAIYLKLPPDDLTDDQHAEIVEVSIEYGVTALELTNTSLSEGLKSQVGHVGLGGISGAALFNTSTRVLARVARHTKGRKIDLIGVGGITTSAGALVKKSHGAKAIQVYSGLVYRGTRLVHEILRSWRRSK
jgi:dihydroorotate dehydrogenase